MCAVHTVIILPVSVSNRTSQQLKKSYVQKRFYQRDSEGTEFGLRGAEQWE